MLFFDTLQLRLLIVRFLFGSELFLSEFAEGATFAISFYIIEHSEDVESHSFLVLELLIDSDLLQSDFTLSHLTILAHKLALFHEIVIFFDLIQLWLIIFLQARFSELVIHMSMASCIHLYDDFREFFLHIVDAFGKVVQAACCDDLHFFENTGEVTQQLEHFELCNDKHLTFEFCNRHCASDISALVEDDLDVAKVTALHAHIDRDILSIFVGSRTEDIVVQLDSALDDEENFLGRIVLAVKCVIYEDLHL